MDWYWSPAGLTMAAIAPLLAGLAWSAWRQRPASSARSLAVVMLAACWWSIAYALELNGASLLTVRFFGDLKYLGIVLLAPAWLIFTLRYTERQSLITGPRLAALGVMPVLTVLLLANGATHDLVRPYPDLRPGGVPYLAMGPLFWVHTAYTYALLLAGACLLIGTCLRASRAYRVQGVIVAVALGVCMLSNVLHIAGVGHFRQFDVTPFGVLLAGSVLAWGVLRDGLLQLVPVARDVVIERMSDAVVVVDTHRRVVDLNPAARALFGWPSVIGQPVDLLLPQSAALLERPGSARDAHSEVRLGPRGQDYDLAVSVLRDRGGRTSGHVLVLRDITARKRDEARLSRLAHEDPLTGLPNRKLFTDRLDATLQAAQVTGRPFGLLFCDIDRFKRINDTLGHEMGDLVLQHVAARLASCVRAGDTVARLGGDEFVVLLPDIDEPADIETIARHLVTVLDQPVVAGGHELYLTLSVGACRYPDGGRDASTLLRHADRAMYGAKAAGRDRVVCHPNGSDDASLDRLRLERDLHGQRDQLELWYQPITSLVSGACIGVEALLRWRHPRQGLLAPGLFVPLAEQSGLVADLGAWVLEEACAQAARWRREHGVPFSVAVNLSARQIEPGLPAHVARVLEDTGVEASCLTCEITESAVLHDEAGALLVLAELSDLGVRIATDDFGTGYTSLEQLRRYPLDVLKIDQSFVRGLQARSSEEVIVPALVSLAHDLGLTVVAEGVETPQQRERLASYSCDAAQGFLFAPPLEVEAAGAYLANALAPTR